MTADVTKLPPGFARLWTTQTASSLGDAVTHVALPLVALTLTRDPMALAVVTAAGTLPWLLFGMIGGALVDRWDRRRAMWVTDTARAVLLAIPAAAAALDALSIPPLAVVAFLLGLGGLFFDTASTAYLPDLQRATRRCWNVPTPACAAPRPPSSRTTGSASMPPASACCSPRRPPAGCSAPASPPSSAAHSAPAPR